MKLISHAEAEARKKSLTREIAEILHPGRRYGEVFDVSLTREFPPDSRVIELPYTAIAKDGYDGRIFKACGRSELHALRALRTEAKKIAAYWEFMRSR